MTFALTVGSVPRRILPKLRHLHWLLKNNRLNLRNLGTIIYTLDRSYRHCNGPQVAGHWQYRSEGESIVGRGGAERSSDMEEIDITNRRNMSVKR